MSEDSLQFTTSGEESQPSSQPSSVVETKVYKRRWLIVLIFALYSASNAVQWLQYSIITNIVMKYYNVSSFAVDMTSMIYMLAYIPFVFPASYVLEKCGLRNAMIVGGICTVVGACIKIYSVSPDLFWVTFVGQTVTAIGQTFVLPVPAQLASVWFGPDQVSLACSIGVLGNQLGVAIGFVLPSMVVPNSENINVIGEGLHRLYHSVAVSALLIFILIALFVKDEPPLPPSSAQAIRREAELSENFSSSMKRLMTNKGYWLLLLSYAINVGVFYAISTLLNRVFLQHFPDHEIDAGRIGFTIVLAGLFGSLFSGIVLDATRKFKETTVGIYIFSLLGMLAFTSTLESSSILVFYVTSGLLGFFMTGYIPVGFELAAELTYPVQEGISTGLLNAVTQAFGVLLTLLNGYIFDLYGDSWSNIALTCILFIGTILTCIIPNDLRRQNAVL